MSRFTALICLLATLTIGEVQAQEFQDAEFGIIPDSLSALAPPEGFSETSYMITNKELDISFRENDGSIAAVLEHHVRMKIFDASAREASIVAIPYYFDNGMEQISGIEGQTYLPNGEQVRLQQKNIRTVNINPRYNVKEFTMPAIEEGAILEYRYTIVRRYIEELPEFFLSHEVPTGAAKLTITYPKYLRYQPEVENYSGKVQNDIVYTDTSSVPKIFTIPQPPPMVSERWMTYNIPPIKQEPFITTLNDYRGKIKFLMSKFGIPRQSLENSWAVVIAKLRRNINPLKQAAQNTLAYSKGDSVAKANSSLSSKELQDQIFQFVNNRMSFSGNYGPYSTQRDEVVLEGAPADQAAVNQTLLAMLKGAGIEAAPVLISTRESGKIDRDFPSFYQFNALVVQTEIEGKSYLLDASFPHSQPGLIPTQMYNGPGLLLAENDYKWTEIDPDKSRFDINVDVNAALSSDGALSGIVSAQQGGYPVQKIRQQQADGVPDSEIVRQMLFDGYGELSLDSVQINNVDDYEKPTEISAEFRIENYATSFSDGLEYRPMVVGYRPENPFEDKNRRLPVTLDAPEKLEVSYTIALPSGYSVQRGKGNQSMNFEGAAFEESYDLGETQLAYDFQINIEKYEFSVEKFSQLYDLYERWAELSNTRWLIEK